MTRGEELDQATLKRLLSWIHEEGVDKVAASLKVSKHTIGRWTVGINKPTPAILERIRELLDRRAGRS